MEVRPARADELDAVAQLWWASFQSTGLARPGDDDVGALRGRLDGELSGGWRLFVADDDGAVVGMLVLAGDTLSQLFIAPDRKGEGIGTRLFEHACAELPGGFTLKTRVANERARRFYEARGMRLDRVGPDPTGDPRPSAWYRWP